MVLGFWQTMRNHGFFLYLQGFILHMFPHFFGCFSLQKAAGAGKCKKGGLQARSRSRRAAAGGHSPGPSCFRTDLPRQRRLCCPT